MWDGARNLADLGGLELVAGGETKRGRVFRSAAREWMTDRGWGEARDAGVRTVVDLRNEMEHGRSGVHPVIDARATAGVTIVSAPTEDPSDALFLERCGPWLDHPCSWTDNLQMFPEKIARVLDAVGRSTSPVLIHCAGGRDRTGMVGSLLLLLAGATPDSIVANYEAGFRGAAEHRGHGWSFDEVTDGWVHAADEPRTDQELDTALDDRRPALLDWVETFDAEGYLVAAGVDEGTRRRIERLLVD